ncbi:hypothetical protein GC194_15420 [bacterium]|nr:hypothetical protein [bacterium]
MTLTLKIYLTNRRKTNANSTYLKEVVQWLNQAFCFCQSSFFVDREVHQIPLHNAKMQTNSHQFTRGAHTAVLSPVRSSTGLM